MSTPAFTPIGALLSALMIGGWGGFFVYEHTHSAAEPAADIQTVTTAPACSDMARTWQQIALRYSRVATLAATGHHHQAGVEAQRTIRFVHSARVHHLIRNGACK